VRNIVLGFEWRFGEKKWEDKIFYSSSHGFNILPSSFYCGIITSNFRAALVAASPATAVPA
jgi:hypothetical protein